MADGGVMAIADVREAIAWQARHSEEAGAPRTAQIIRAELAILDTPTETGRRMAAWPGLSLADAMPLRIAGALHWLHLSGTDGRLAPVYSGVLTEQSAIDALVAEIALDHDTILSPWLDGPPQTNEAGRSASVMAALLWLAERLGSRFELIEIGASAGVNTMMDRYFYYLGGTVAGPADSAMRIVPEWRGPPPPQKEVEIVALRGCDVAPVDLTDPAQALRLKAYVWADAIERMGRLDTAIALARQAPPDLVEADAAEFVQRRLAAPQPAGVTRALFHTVMWQYLPEHTRREIKDAMLGEAEQATRECPLAWISLETNRRTFRHELVVRYWPGCGDAVLLATAHPHGAWVEWIAAAAAKN